LERDMHKSRPRAISTQFVISSAARQCGSDAGDRSAVRLQRRRSVPGHARRAIHDDLVDGGELVRALGEVIASIEAHPARSH
jgi:hypothetical protein